MTERTNEAALWPTAHQAIMAGQSPEIPGPVPKAESAGTRIAASEVTCGAVPVQIEGRLTDGRFFYFRARHRGVSLGFGDSPDAAVVGPGPAVSFDGIGDHAVGWMDVALAQSLLAFLVGAVIREEEIAAEASNPPASPTQPAANQEPGA